jgi:hypothetical protein
MRSVCVCVREGESVRVGVGVRVRVGESAGRVWAGRTWRRARELTTNRHDVTLARVAPGKLQPSKRALHAAETPAQHTRLH